MTVKFSIYVLGLRVLPITQFLDTNTKVNELLLKIEQKL